MGISIAFSYRLHFGEEKKNICDMISAFCSAKTSAIFEVINPCVLIKGKKREKRIGSEFRSKEGLYGFDPVVVFSFLPRRVTNIET